MPVSGRRGRSGERGFTMIETAVMLGVLIPVTIGLYSLLDSSSRLSKQQTNVAQAQVSARGGIYEVARMIRQARVGQLYLGNAVLPVYNDAPAGKTITDISGKTHRIRQGTDVIEVRGVIQGDKYAINSADVTCSGACDGSSQLTIVLRSTAASGVVNFAPTQKPAIAARTRPFYLVMADSSNQPVTAAGKSYLVPLYYVGLVNAEPSGSWYTWSSVGGSATFTFTMNPADAGARRFNAGSAGTPSLQKPFFCGVVDDMVFFVDEGAVATTGDSHPTLSMALFDASSGNYDVQPLVDEAEDFQVAYGVDGADGSTPDGGADPTAVDTSGPGKDEWIGNVANEVESSLGTASALPRTGTVDAFLDTSVATSDTAPVAAKPALRAVWISLVVKSRVPDMRYKGPGASGIVTLDSTATPLSASSLTGQPYQRRLQAMAVSLRNYQ